MIGCVRFSGPILFAAGLLAAGRLPATAQDPAPAPPWIELSEAGSFEGWQSDRHGWTTAAEVALDKDNAQRLMAKPGSGALVSDGDGADLLTAESFQDVELACEFMIPEGSNSGVKLNALYEIQIRDTHGLKDLTGDSCGGVYPRAKLEPRYQHLDAGIPPRTNAARPAGQWQTLGLRFYAPRFDAAGKKVAPARFEKVTLNGELVHDRAVLKHPTGYAWNTKPEVAEGPLMLQGDHGPVAFRHVRVRRLGEPAK